MAQKSCRRRNNGFGRLERRCRTADDPAMKLHQAATTLYAFLALGRVASAQVPVVTETKKVEIAEKDGQKKQVLRKINGRWWSEENREAAPPADGKGVWTVDPEPDAVEFFHHRPFEVARADALHLFMPQAEVGAALGEPNCVVGKDAHAVWLYYTADGTKLTVRFVDDGVLGEASFDAASKMSWPSPAVARELNGRSVDDLIEERVKQRTLETYRSKPFATRTQ
jgi:hypothetical protein